MLSLFLFVFALDCTLVFFSPIISRFGINGGGYKGQKEEGEEEGDGAHYPEAATESSSSKRM